MYNLKNIKVPYLVFHGEDDEVVPVKQAERFKKATSKAGKKIMYISFAMKGMVLIIRVIICIT